MVSAVTAAGRGQRALEGLLTYEEFLARLDPETHAEWVDGEVVMMVPVNVAHNDLTRFLIATLSCFVDARRAGALCHEPFQMKTGPDLPGRAPDLFFVASGNLPRLKPTHLEGPADLVVEVVSPESRGRDRGEKFYEYEQGGVREYWLLDPERRQAEVYALGEDGLYHPLPVDRDGIFRSQVLEGLWLDLSWLWERPPLPDVLRALGLSG